MKEATVTLSNFGSLGEGRWATPMVSPPEVAILAVARITKSPVVREGQVVIRDMLNLSWSFDHRVIDGSLLLKFRSPSAKCCAIPPFYCELARKKIKPQSHRGIEKTYMGMD